MHEKTLLYSALGATAVAAVIGVLYAKHHATDASHVEIAPVSLIESSKNVARAEIPVRLTASDGTGLKLVAMKAEAAVEDPLALTELHLTFENPQNRVLEGTFRITLPQGASMSRFAMKVGGTWQEGEVVEKQAARQAYEDFLHRRQDPALMEQGAGNEFSARVFPIPANGTKEIIITYAEALALGQAYVLPLQGLPELGNLDVDVHVSGQKAAEAGKTDATFGIHQTKITPGGDFVVDNKQLPRSAGLRNGELAMTRVVPFSSSRPEPVGNAIVLLDTSASRGLGIGDQVQELSATLAKLPGDTKVSIACFDQEVVPVYEGTAGGFGDKERKAIVDRGALGASDFDGALVWATTQAKKNKATRVVFFTDGVATAGETDGQKLRTKVEALRGAGVVRMDAIAIGGIRDDGFLRTLTRGVLDRDGVVLDAKLGADALARRLGEATSSALAVKVDGAKWSWPTSLEGLQAGDEVLVYAELDGSQPLKVDIGGQKFAPDVRSVERPLVERAWAQAKIQSLVEAPNQSPEATKTDIIALSTSHRVLSPYTALLVLETDADYRRFNIDRTAKRDILAVENGQVAVTQGGRQQEEDEAKHGKVAKEESRSGPKGIVKPEPPSAAAPAATATAGQPSPMPTPQYDERQAAGDPGAPAPGMPADGVLGGLGLRGAGEGGGGVASGAVNGFGNPAASAAAPMEAPAVAAPTAQAESVPSSPRHANAAPPALKRPSRSPPRPTVSCSPPYFVDANGDRHYKPQCIGDDFGAPVATATATASPLAQQPLAGNVRPGAIAELQGIAADEVQRVVRGAIPQYRTCYQTALSQNAMISGHVAVGFTIDALGNVSVATVNDAPTNDVLRSCFTAASRGLHFPAPGAGGARFVQSFDLVGGGSGSTPPPDGADPSAKAMPYEGRFKTVMDAIGRGDRDAALTEANHWHADAPGDVLSLVALGEVFEARSDARSAARAYGSILELFSFRADSRRFAGERLERLHDAAALALAADTYGKAVEQRPDHPASHRLYAYALLKKGDYPAAFEAIKKGSQRSYPAGRFRGVDRILREDMGLIAAAWMHADPQHAADIRAKLLAAGGSEENGPSLRFVLNWETDANDVDFHIYDGKGGHAYYAQPQLPSGGELYADVTTGYGPECFTIRTPKRAYPYTLQAHYFSRGPMGYGMGKLEVIDHDGKGNLTFEERPFVVMVDHAFVDMGKLASNAPLTASR